MSHCWTRELYTHTHTYVYEMLEETCAHCIRIGGF